MIQADPVRRARGLRRAPAALKRRAALQEAGVRIGGALRGCSGEDRALMALLLLERLTPAEAAQTLGMDVVTIVRRHRALLARLRRAFRGLVIRPSRAGDRRAILPLARAREAS